MNTFETSQAETGRKNAPAPSVKTERDWRLAFARPCKKSLTSQKWFRNLWAIVAALLFTLASNARADLSYTFASGTDCAMTNTSGTYVASGTLNVSLGFALAVGTNLTVIKNTGLCFISGSFSNVAQGAVVPLIYNGQTYNFIANYYGGNGRSLVLQWAGIGIVAWGQNLYGQLGNSGTANSSVPVVINTSGAWEGKIPLATAAGSYHSLALTSDGRVFAWGRNNYGQLGNSGTANSLMPVSISGSGLLAGKTVVAIAAGAYHSLALTSDGQLFAWGYNSSGQLGNNDTKISSVPEAVSGSGVLNGKTVVAIAAGYYHSMALTSDGQLFAWGDNAYGELGDTSTTNRLVPVAVYTGGIPTVKTVTAIAGGVLYSMALNADGQVFAWGWNNSGQLGNSGTSNSSVPVPVTTSGVLAGKTVVAIAVGYGRSMALTSDGQLFAWGSSTTNSSVPVAVDTSGVLAGKTVVSITNGVGANHSFALVAISAPTITIQPVSQTVTTGGTVMFTATANDLNTSTIQWQVSVTGPFGTFSNIDSGINPSATTGTLTLANVDLSQNGYAYRAVFTNPEGSATTSAATLIVAKIPDSTGPTLSAPCFLPANTSGTLTLGGTLSGNGSFSVNASDPSGMGTVSFLIHPTSGGEDVSLPVTNTGATYTAYWDALNTPADGGYVLTIRATDSLGNLTTGTYALTLNLAPPSAPAITAPVNGFISSQSTLTFSGTVMPGCSLAFSVNGTANGVSVTADAKGNFSQVLTLPDGTSTVTVAAQNRVGSSAQASVSVSVDRSVPGAPTGLQAFANPGGRIQLSWIAPANIPAASLAGYTLYRAAAPFTDLSQAVQLNATLLAGNSYTDTPPTDGTYYYRVVATNKPGTSGDLSVQVSAVSDRVLPNAVSIAYAPAPGCKYDPDTGRFGTGMVNVTLTASEPLGSTPFLSLTPTGGQVIPVSLQQTDALHYNGFFVINSITPSGTANAVVSLLDPAGNSGSAIGSGKSILIDTAGPRVVDLTMSSGTIAALASIQNNPAQPAVLTFAVTFDTPGKQATVPQFFYTLSKTATVPAAIAGITPGADNLHWIATLPLPATAGQQTETLTLSFSALDDLDNTGTTIVPTHRWQVYQGNLPGFDSPLQLTAESQPGGKITLSWMAVANAADYLISRRSSGSESFTPLIRSGGELSYIDQPSADGSYDYTVSSVRQENGQESLSASSNIATALSDRVAPPPPQNVQVKIVAQGVKATWQAPAGLNAPIVYKLYRAATATAGTAGEVLSSNINSSQLWAIDPTPNMNKAWYYVAAVDNAGNESAPTNAAYQNIQLLPVQNLSVTQTDSSPPVLAWTQVSGNIAGYNVYETSYQPPMLLNQSRLITTTSFTDTTYTPTADRNYMVITVDTSNQQSPAHDLTLPRVCATLDPATIIKKGVMNQLNFAVVNSSTTALNNVAMKVHLAGIDHTSGTFSVPASGTMSIPVVVGGYSTLSGTTTQLTHTLQITPNPGETVSVVRNVTAPLGSDQLRLSLVLGEFQIGGVGKVQVDLINTSSETIEITTACNNGSAPSDEVAFSLYGGDNSVYNNLLAQTPLQLVTDSAETPGAQLVTLPSGRTVLRLDPGAEYLSPEVALTIPAGISFKQGQVQLQISKVYYHQGQSDQVVMDGMNTNAAVSFDQSPYYGIGVTATPASSGGNQPVVITGTAIDRATGNPTPNARLTLSITVAGFVRTYDVYTDSTGAFSYSFQPLPGETGGVYSVSVNHPTQTARPVQATFTIQRVAVSPLNGSVRTVYGAPTALPFTITPGPTCALTNARIQCLPEDQSGGVLPAGVSVTLDAPIASVTSGQGVSLKATITGTAGSAAPSGTLVFRLTSDEAPAPGWVTMTLKYQFGDAAPALNWTPNNIVTGVKRGDTVTEYVTIRNVGFAAATGMRYSAKVQGTGASVPAWVRVIAPQNADIAPCAQAQVGVTLVPDTSVPDGDYAFLLHAEGVSGQPSCDVAVQATITDSQTGGAVFKVTDPFTGTLDDKGNVIQGLQRATVQLQNTQANSQLYTFITGSDGTVVTGGILPAACYSYRVSADKHSPATGQIWIRPGATVSQDVALAYNPVTIEWSVVPVGLTDSYQLVVNETYETHVPMPVVAIDPPNINLPKMAKGDVFNGEFTVTNQGLINADDFAIGVPPDDGIFKYEMLDGLPASLAAGQSLHVSYRATALQDFGTTASGTAASSGTTAPAGPMKMMTLAATSSTTSSTGAPCGPYTTTIPMSWDYWCANGQHYVGSTNLIISGYIPCTSNSGTGTIVTPPWIFPPINPVNDPTPVTPAPSPISTGLGGCVGKVVYGSTIYNFDERPLCLEPVGCNVNLLNRTYEDDITDLSVLVPGHAGSTAALIRKFRDGQWQFFDKLQYTQDPTSSVDKYTDVIWQNFRFYVADATNTLFRSGNLQIQINYPSDTARAKLISPDGSFVTFDANGVIRATGRNDITYTTVEVDASGRPEQVSSAGQPLLTYTWTGNNLTSISDKGGDRVTYTYNGTLLKQVQDVAGGITTYAYDSSSRLSKITDSTGLSHTISYSSGNSVASVLDSNGNGKTFTYNYDQSTGIYYALTKYNSGKFVENWFYSDGGLKTRKVNGLLIQDIQRDGMAYIITGPNNRVWREDRNDYGNVTKMTMPDGSTRSYTYDPATQLLLSMTNENGIVSEITYDKRRNPETVTQAKGTPVEAMTSMAYNGNDAVTSVAQPKDAQTLASTISVAYDANGEVQTVTDPLMHVSQVVARNALGSVTQMQDANNQTWNYDYDALNRVSKVTNPDSKAVQFAFDGFNNLTSITAPSGSKLQMAYDINNSLISATDPAGKSSNNVYDGDGQLTQSTDAEGKTTFYQYDGFGRVTQTSDAMGNHINYTYSSTNSSNVPLSISTPKLTRTFTYDKNNQVIQAVDSTAGMADVTRTYTYTLTGALQTAVDGEGRKTTYTYDALDHVTSIVQDGVGTSSFTRDARGNVIAFTNPNDKIWQYAYDASGQLLQETTPLGKVTAFAYDNVGNLTTITKPNGVKIVRFFNSAGQVMSVQEYDTDGATLVKTTTFKRDADGRVSDYDDGTTRGAMTFDAVGRLLTETVNYGSFSATQVYSYYDNGQLKSYTSPSGMITTYAYDAGGRLQTATNAIGVFTVNSYDFTAVQKVTLPGGAVQQFTRNAYQQPTQIQSSISGTQALLNLAFDYTAEGNVKSRDRGAGPVAFQYDNANRLLQGETGKYTYDPNGNRLTDTAIGASEWRYDADDRLTSDTVNSYTYSDNGERKQKNGLGAIWSYTYDAQGQLTQVMQGSAIIRYTYDPNGRRVSKNVNGVVTYYIYDAFGLCAEFDASGNLQKEYGYLPATGAPLYQKTAGGNYFYHCDQLGTPLRMTDVNGNTVWAAMLDDFGRAYTGIQIVENNLRFPGQYFDAETGLHYNGHRYYDPQIGRYISADPARDGNNYHAYCSSNPFSYCDSSGLREEDTDVMQLGGNIYYVLPDGTIDENATSKNAKLPANWEVLKVETNRLNGFYAVSYRNIKTGKIALIFRGSTTWIDWCVNLANGIGLPTSQYQETKELAQAYVEVFGKDNIIFGGHSKAGGQAALASLATGARAVIANAAYPGQYWKITSGFYWGAASDDNITKYRTKSDPLSILSSILPGKELGKTYYVPGAGHTSDNFNSVQERFKF